LADICSAEYPLTTTTTTTTAMTAQFRVLPSLTQETKIVEALSYNEEDCGISSRSGFLGFSLNLFFRPHCGPGVDSAANINEYQESFLGVKAAGS
jgi:hypothetical protein